ncbi:ribosomal protein S25 [Caldisphaera lagunensis DSM 15908]|uniref:Ribosomal protein S25 n=1 Tax=Caldisphaera lagunensis (strain DSM 15908 / JCM 11604 / ANMR 0165 / IC-154) TaxID=1056495 RepID=L0ACJ5_CALLD|nr:30S ribosomal protein S25e [Caldisphaera lagunensis]AFZ70867.1 ribosomal protein S25 [Caldisphaera lagunensis DSM 15908]
MSKEVSKKPGKQPKAKEEKKQTSAFDASSELISRVKKDLAKLNYVTPYKVANSYNVALSTARRILKELEKEGVLVLYSPSRRNPVYILKQ